MAADPDQKHLILFIYWGGGPIFFVILIIYMIHKPSIILQISPNPFPKGGGGGGVVGAVLTLATRMFIINEKLFLFAIVDRYPFATCVKDIFV